MYSNKKIKVVLQLCMVLALICSIGYSVMLEKKLRGIRTNSFIDTIKVYVPVPVDSVVTRYVDVYLPKTVINYKDSTVVKDSTVITEKNDSSLVHVPITQKHYKEKNYEAWVSGFMPSLDSLNVYEKTNTIVVPEKKFPLEVTLGLQAGAGISNGNVIQPYVGVGVQVGVPVRKIFKKRKHR